MDNSEKSKDELQVSSTQEDEETFDVLPDMTPAQLRMFISTPLNGKIKEETSEGATGIRVTPLPSISKGNTHANTFEETIKTEETVFYTEVSMTDEEAKIASKAMKHASLRQKTPRKIKKDSPKQSISKSKISTEYSKKKKKEVQKRVKDSGKSLNPASPLTKREYGNKVRKTKKTDREATDEVTKKKTDEPSKPKEIRKTFKTAFAEDKTFVSTEEAFTEYEMVDAKIRPFVFRDRKRWVKKQTINLNRRKPLGIASDEIGSMRERRRVQTPTREIIGKTSAEKQRSQREIFLEFKKYKPQKKTARKSTDKRDISVEVREENIGNLKKEKGGKYWFFGKNKVKTPDKSDSQLGSNQSGLSSSTTSTSKFSSSTN